jgi:hypothetical protein
LILLATIASIALGVLLGIAGGIANAAARQAAPPGQPVFPGQAPLPGAQTGIALVLPILMMIVYVLFFIAHLIGDILCIGAPRKYGARSLAVTAVVLASVTIFGQVSGFLLPPLQLVGGLAWTGHIFVFLIFLRAIARAMRAYGLESNLKYLIVLFSVGIGSMFIAFIILIVALGAAVLGALGGGGAPGAVAGLGAGALVGAACMCISALIMLAFVVWYIVVLAQIRTELGRYVEG